MTGYMMDGVSGEKVVLEYDTLRHKCLARVRHIAGVIAELPMNTSDAVLTDNGFLVYKGRGMKTQAVSIATCGTISNTGGIVTNGVIVGGPIQVSPNAVSASKIKVGDFTRDLIAPLERRLEEQQKRMKELGAAILEMKESHATTVTALLASIKYLKSRNDPAPAGPDQANPAARPDSAADHPDTDERCWTDRGGLHNGPLAAIIDNPFDRNRKVR